MEFVGPSYTLANYKAAAQSTVNMYLVPIETADKQRYILTGIPGGVRRLDLGGEIRGYIEAAGRVFVVSGASVYEIRTEFEGVTPRGVLTTTTGRVSLAYGTTQLVVADGVGVYVLTLATNVWAQVTDADLTCKDTVAFLDNYFILSAFGRQFQITAINDASIIDGLDFASAESAPDDLVSHAVSNGELYLFKVKNIEVWFNSGGSDFPFARNKGVAIDVGLYAAGSLVEVDEALMFVGRDDNGAGMVYAMRGYAPKRISTLAVEEALRESSDLTAATAYAYAKGGHAFYCINAPGTQATWCYDVLTQTWHERCDLDLEGQFIQHRTTHAVFGYGQTIMGDAQGKIYTLSDDVYQWDGDPIVRQRTSPHDVGPSLDPKFFSRFVLDTECGATPLGETPIVELNWSDDGGAEFGNWVPKSIGARGNRYPRLVWNRLGRSNDRVWRVRCADNAKFSINGAKAE